MHEVFTESYAGYPYSVSEDYLRYQSWDTMQAFASSMTAALATEAVLKGAGVGDQSASALAASLTWIAKDGLGMIGSELDYDCKKWRLVADIMNDVAFFVDLLSPALPGLFFVCACTSSLLRCVVGVAVLSLNQVFEARRNNLADVSSKDGSQETMVNMTALLASLIMLPLVSGKHTLIWSLFVIFTGVHLYANYRAVRSLNIETLNLKRATILIRVSSALLRVCDNYTLLYDTYRNIGWVALSESAPDICALNAVFDIEVLSSQDIDSEKKFGTFLAQLKSKGWRVEGANLGSDEWNYSTK
ncbi:hypothetical protein NECAME_08966 [Necator americanus]|uniref:Protein root UVB sensitive/RUS domain-containing protein n=1 Tax=Necator americanus TaxID=51031 RepID=W2TFF6_NECAM|nr:hypothetical protein NECAME_08966 [Necator americanus]ETN80760.1 hypothetical protein NECAME_08966 [Necator americanus]